MRSLRLALTYSTHAFILAGLISGCGGPLSGGPDLGLELDFTLEPERLTVVRGSSVSMTATITRRELPNSEITWTLQNPPAGVSATYNRPSTTADYVVVTIQTTAATPIMTHQMGLFGEEIGGDNVDRYFYLVVSPPGPEDFSLSVVPDSQTVPLLNVAQFDVLVSPIRGYAGTVTLSIPEPIAGLYVTLSPQQVVLGEAAMGRLSVYNTSVTGARTVPLTVTASDGLRSHSQTVNVVIPP